MAAQTWRPRARLFGLGLAAVSLVGGALAVRADQSVQESLTEFSFQTPAVTVQLGETAHFQLTNEGRFPHSMTIEDADGVKVLAAPDANLAAGETGTLDAVFTKAGTYQFWCPVGNHRDQGMVGTITVFAPIAPAAPASVAPALAPAPAAPRAPTPKARDGQSLDTQTAATQASFIAVWGNQAGTEWVKEHDAALTSQGR